MPVRTSGYILLQQLSQRISLKNSYRTSSSGVLKTTWFNQWNSVCQSFTNKSPQVGPVSSMPVITAVAVAAHRTTVHSSEQRIAAQRRFSNSSQCRSSATFNLENVTNNSPYKRSISMNFPMDFTSCIGSNNNKSPAGGIRTEDYRRYYAKGRDKPKNKKSVVTIDEAEMSEIINVDAFKSQLETTMEEMKEEFSTQLSVRGAAGALETLLVEFEGETYPLQELAQVGRKNPQLAVLNLSSLPDACQPVIKAIQASGMNLNPQQEGTTIYVPLPKVTREHRENLAKNAKLIFNKTKVAFQAIQNKFVKQCKSHKEGISEDLAFSVQNQIMKLTESYIEDAEKLMQSKQKELLDIK